MKCTSHHSLTQENIPNPKEFFNVETAEFGCGIYFFGLFQTALPPDPAPLAPFQGIHGTGILIPRAAIPLESTAAALSSIRGFAGNVQPGF